MANTKPTQPSITPEMTKAELDLQATKQLMTAEVRRKALHKVYKGEDYIPVQLAPSYAKHFGKVMSIIINGILVAVRVDGTTQKIPRTFAEEVHRRRMAIDNKERMEMRMADIQKNFEAAPGELRVL